MQCFQGFEWFSEAEQVEGFGGFNIELIINSAVVSQKYADLYVTAKCDITQGGPGRLLWRR